MMVQHKKWEYAHAKSCKNMSVMIVLLMIYKYALSDSQKWRNMSAVIVVQQLTEWDYAPTASQKWQEHVSMTTAHEI